MLWVLMTAALLAALMAAPIIIEIKSCRKRFFTIRLKVFGLPTLKKTVYLHLRRYIRPEIVLVKRGGAFKRIYSFSLKSIINKKRSKKIDYTAFMPELRFIDASIVLGAENIAVSCMLCGVMRAAASAISPHLPGESRLEILPCDAPWVFQIKGRCIFWLRPWNIICKLFKRAIKSKS